MKMVVLALALFVATLAHADGVALLSPPTAALTAETAQRIELAKRHGVVTVYPVTVNPKALDSSVITVVLEGKQYRFVGKKTTQTMLLVVGGKQTTSIVDTWRGDGGSPRPQDNPLQLSLSREGTFVVGTITVGTQTYQLLDSVLMKSGASPKI